MIAYVGDPQSPHFCWARFPRDHRPEALSWIRRVRNKLMQARPDLGIVVCGTHAETTAARFRTPSGQPVFPPNSQGAGDSLGVGVPRRADRSARSAGRTGIYSW